MIEFAKRPLQELGTYFQEASARRGVNLEIVEKDFWVCWVLKLLFSQADLKQHFLFKGGTSLSKVFGIIHRFSEDVDISVDPEWLGFGGGNRLDVASSRSQFAKRERELEERCCKAIEISVWPLLEQAVVAVLGALPEARTYLTYEVDPATHSPNLLLAYPRLSKASGALKPRVKLEFGSLYDQRPTGSHRVTPIVAEVFPPEFSEPSAEVFALEAERTFWEKATILHAEYHRADDSPTPAGLSRHFYDLHCLSVHPAGQRALKDSGLRDEVVAFKQRYFYSKWAHYETAHPGSFRLVPDARRLAEIQRDYQRMADMFMKEPPGFSDLISALKSLEQQINKDLNT